jgi:DUF2924 family protein
VGAGIGRMAEPGHHSPALPLLPPTPTVLTHLAWLRWERDGCTMTATFRPRISRRSPESWPLDTSDIVIAGAARIHLMCPPTRAFMDMRLTEPRREKQLEISTLHQIEGLKRMTVGQLRQKHVEVFGEESRSNHRRFLFRRIAWRIQALAEGGLSKRARRRALEIANDADLRIRAPRGAFQKGELVPALTVRRKVPCDADPRLPVPGTLLTRRYKERDVIVKVLKNGFEFEGKIYRSLSAIAREVTGTKWNGYVFFNLEQAAGRTNGCN